jgi:hypothetical protein
VKRAQQNRRWQRRAGDKAAARTSWRAQANVAASTIRRIENGVPPHTKTIDKIARALECAPTS